MAKAKSKATAKKLETIQVPKFIVEKKGEVKDATVTINGKTYTFIGEGKMEHEGTTYDIESV